MGAGKRFMPKEITNHDEILEAIRRVDIINELEEKHDGHFKYELELEVIAYGRNYNGKKVGPYIKLKKYSPGEQVIRQGDWSGNEFFINVDGTLDVYVRDDKGNENKVGELPPGVSFGEMAILAGVPRNASIVVPQGREATVLELTRPALRLLRKLPKFGRALDYAYRNHGLGRTLEDVRQATGGAFDKELLKQLGNAARFMVYGKNHFLFREGETVDRVIFIKNGWIRRVRGIAFNPNIQDLVLGSDEKIAVDFLGAGNCLGLEGVNQDAQWKYTATVLSRTEVLEVSIPFLRQNPKLRDTLFKTFSDFSTADDDVTIKTGYDKFTMAAAEKEITTGVVDGTNLLVMDMDKCVRCGNCSMACHVMHGHSRLLRRGIHIERPKKIGKAATQHVLVPSVCMHCQDPECLTGCPTGAISRFEGGQIDITPKTCIGCSDCATQCPYNAITMIPRKEPVAPQPKFWQKWISLAPPKEPPPVTETESLVATKCNLCNNTPMNPAGTKQNKYSCQENCPTGALVRVNPREYFTEVQQKLGVIYKDQTHAIGRDIHKSDPLAALWNVGGTLATIALTVLTIWGMFKYGLDGKLFGSSWLTIRWITGIVGLVGIGVVMAYPGRKQVYRRRAGALRYWLLSHIYLGIIAGILLLLHGGKDTGGLLTSVLMISFDLVILTGLFGIACYLIAPRIMTSIEGEPLLVEDLRARRDELRQQLADIGEHADEEFRRLVEKKVRGRYLSLGFLLRQYIRREELTALLAEARERFEPEARNLSDPNARKLLLEAVEATVMLRRVDSLIYLHQLLKLWLAPHVVATSIMLVTMLVHIVQVVFFRVH
jgi:Fe-S-cluster-containing dehydrogenase component/CRP-like cAMP-binding protein